MLLGSRRRRILRVCPDREMSSGTRRKLINAATAFCTRNMSAPDFWRRPLLKGRSQPTGVKFSAPPLEAQLAEHSVTRSLCSFSLSKTPHLPSATQTLSAAAISEFGTSVAKSSALQTIFLTRRSLENYVVLVVEHFLQAIQIGF